jgi:hypothetical protein
MTEAVSGRGISAWIAMLALAGLALPLHAQEIERSRPWTAMDGRNAGAVGTCPDVDGGDGDTCYIVRCQPKLGLAFVIQHDGIADDDVRSIKISHGRYSEVIRLSDGAADERFAALSAHPGLLKLLLASNARRWADLMTVETKFHYSTQIELTRAKTAIGKIAKACKQ